MPDRRRSVTSAQSGAVVGVNHAGNASTARPTTTGIVLWSGTVEPTNAITGDVIVII